MPTLSVANHRLNSIKGNIIMARKKLGEALAAALYGDPRSISPGQSRRDNGSGRNQPRDNQQARR